MAYRLRGGGSRRGRLSQRHSVATMFTEEAGDIGHATTLLQQRNERSRLFYNRLATKVEASRLSAQGLAELRKSSEVMATLGLPGL